MSLFDGREKREGDKRSLNTRVVGAGLLRAFLDSKRQLCAWGQRLGTEHCSPHLAQSPDGAHGV